MKKVIIIAMLMTLLCVCGLSAGVCFADETSTSTNEWYYFEKSDTTPNLYLREEANGESKILLFIPHSYAFEKTGDASGAYVKVSYNGIEGYILTNTFNSNCKPVTSKWGNYPYEYKFTDVTVKSSQITLYNKKTMDIIGTEEQGRFRIDKVYGYYYKDNEYYFLAETSSISMGNYRPNDLGYIKASDTNRATFSEETIPVNSGYTLQTTPEKPTTPSGEITSGDQTTSPSADKNGSDTQTPKNSLDRYILIAVIAVLCVVIIILIFVPTRKRS